MLLISARVSSIDTGSEINAKELCRKLWGIPDLTGRRHLLSGMSHGTNHYAVLGLSGPSSLQDENHEVVLKGAYHDALLRHHPDKSRATATPGPSIDSIKLAFSVLSNPVTRAQYNQELAMRNRLQGESDANFRTGEELVDLDDMVYDTEQNHWHRGCRCGETKGYVATEDMLESAETNGLREIVVGCIGCSLWLRIAFDISDEAG